MKSKNPKDDKKDIAKELGAAEKSYRNSYIIGAIFIVFMLVMVIISFYPQEAPLEDDSIYPSRDVDILQEITIKNPLPFNIPVKISVKLSSGTDVNEKVFLNIYFMKKDDAFNNEKDIEMLKQKSIKSLPRTGKMDFEASLEPGTAYVFVMVLPEGASNLYSRVNVHYEVNSYPFMPYLPIFIGIGLIGCIVPFIYIQIDLKKTKKLRKALIKEKRTRQKKLSKQGKGTNMPPPIVRPTPPQAQQWAGPQAQQYPPHSNPRYHPQTQSHYPVQTKAQSPPQLQSQPMQTGAQEKLAYIIQQLQVLRQQEAVVSNQLKMEGPSEQKQLLLGRYQEIQTQKQLLQQQAQALQGVIQREKLQSLGSEPARPRPPSPDWYEQKEQIEGELAGAARNSPQGQAGLEEIFSIPPPDNP